MSSASQPENHPLSAEQQAAAHYMGGPLRIIAGAGTGKTSTLTARFVYLVREQNVPAHEILAVTFSAKAATEMRSRIVRQLGGTHRRLWIQTFHALCLRLLGEWSRERGEPDPRVLSDLERMRLLRVAVEGVPLTSRRFYHGNHGSRAFTRDLGTYVDRLHDDLAIAAGAATHSASARLADLELASANYLYLLESQGAVDFAVLSSRVVRLLESDADLREQTRARFQHLLVDEFQDTNHAQFRLIELIAPASYQICVVGDENQAIYAFRGGQSAYFNTFMERFPKAKSFELKENYRSGAAILSAANNLVVHNRSSAQLELIAMNNDAPAIVTVTVENSAELEAEAVARRILAITNDRSKNISFRDIAVLFRSVRSQAEPFRRALALYGIPYSLGPVLGLDYSIRQDVRAAVRLVQCGPDWASAARLALGHGGPALGRQSLERRRTPEHLLELVQSDGWSTCTRDETAFLGAVRAVLDATAGLFADSPARLLYNAMVLSGHMRETLDPAQAQHLRQLLSAAERCPSTDDLDDLLTGGAPGDDDQVPDDQHGVQLLTVHASKGLEWPVVFVAGMAEGVFPIAPRADHEGDLQALVRSRVDRAASTGDVRSDFDRDHYQEERRLAYVAVTRAKRELHLSRAATYGVETHEQSRFLPELGYPNSDALPIDDEYVRLTTLFALGRDIRGHQRRARQVWPASEDGSAALADLILAQWAASRVPGVNPIRERKLPHPHDPDAFIPFSASELESYESCPRRYLYATLLKLEREDHGVHALLGTVVHGVLERVNRYRQEFGHIPTDAQVHEIIDELWPEVGFDLGIQSRQYRSRATVMILRYIAWERTLPAGRTPIWIEEYARVDYAGHTLRGKVDLVMANADGSYNILDFKTGSTSGFTTSRQLYLYLHIWRKRMPDKLGAPVDVSLVALRSDADKGNQLARTWQPNQIKTAKVTEDWIEKRRDETDQLLAGIVLNQFAGVPNQCDRCPFQRICPDAR